MSGLTGLETEFDLDKHRGYDVPRSRQQYDDDDDDGDYDDEENGSMGDTFQDDDQLTDEQRAWAGIDEILDDGGSVGDDDDGASGEIGRAHV